MKMGFIDLKAQQNQFLPDGTLLRDAINLNISKVLDHGKYIQGPEIFELEEKLAKYVGVDYCISNSSGTDALLIALMALGVKRGDEVITTPFSFFATVETILLLGAIPVYVDIDPNTFNIDSTKIEEKITSNTKAIVAVSLYGQPANFQEINSIANKFKLPVIEDGAQSFGATHHGKRSCGLTTIGTTSFFPSKPLGCYGDGGACFTNDSELAEQMRKISLHGQSKRYFHTEIGINGRLDTIQAAILLAKLPLFETEVKERNRIGSYYTNQFEKLGVQGTPKIRSHNTSVYGQYTMLVENRSALQNRLLEFGIPTAVHYPEILPNQPATFKDNESLALRTNSSNEKTFTVALKCSQRVLSLPIYPCISKDKLDHIISKFSSLLV